MTTDTIPEVSELCAMLDNETNSQRIAAHAGELMEAYYKRKLEECGGDARELLKKLYPPVDSYTIPTDEEAVELVQLHTAKAVEEQKKETYRLAKEWRNDVAKLEDERATLQKQCEELRRENEALANQVALPLFTMRVVKERDSLRTRAEKAEADNLALRLAVADGTTALRDKLTKAEAEVAELKKWKQEDPRMLREQIRIADAAFQSLHERHDQLQQDVRPLLTPCHITSDMEAHNHLLETFLAKHPWAKETP